MLDPQREAEQVYNSIFDRVVAENVKGDVVSDIKHIWIEQITDALTRTRQAALEEAARIAESVSILADYEKSCYGDAPEMLLRKTIAKAIRQTGKVPLTL